MSALVGEMVAADYRRRVAQQLRRLANRVEAGELLLIDGQAEAHLRQLASEEDWERWQATGVIDWNLRFFDLSKGIQTATMAAPSWPDCMEEVSGDG